MVIRSSEEKGSEGHSWVVEGTRVTVFDTIASVFASESVDSWREGAVVVVRGSRGGRDEEVSVFFSRDNVAGAGAEFVDAVMRHAIAPSGALPETEVLDARGSDRLATFDKKAPEALVSKMDERLLEAGVEDGVLSRRRPKTP